jgi:hypothetical protein
MKYAVEMCSGAMLLHMPSFMKIGSGVQKLIWGRRIHRADGDRISLLPFFFKMRRGDPIKMDVTTLKR